jgi:hypothetical protein
MRLDVKVRNNAPLRAFTAKSESDLSTIIEAALRAVGARQR